MTDARASSTRLRLFAETPIAPIWSNRRLQAQLAELGFISSGTVVRRHTFCGKAGCRCQGDPPQPHGPYFQWTRKLGGKTVTRRLTEREAALYREWITNSRRLRRIVSEMEAVSARAADLILQDPESS